jgi:NADH-quinone oxidoreductase subunit G
MPRPEPRAITFSIDGREVQAPENSMLVDAAALGDVEIPVFCYEPKLGNPVGACRMCLVEIEGIPKLQTGCSTPVKDGMVVHTQSERVRTAQEAVVEFLLVNHPLDCPVCDKGGECPLQDITFGWGSGISRFIEPKRHFRKPLEISPLIAIDRERCILCYRCVRFSQEIAEDYQLVLVERGAHTYVATFDGHPYVAPFSGNIVELCPVGALTSIPYRFRARPWDIEGAGSVCTLCPAQCNVHFTVRDEKVLRVLARQNPDVDDGWLCDKGRFAYQAIHVDERVTEPMIRDAGELRPVSWERALDEAAAGLRRARGHVGALAGGQTSNEEAFLLARLLREGLDSPDLDAGAGVDPRALQALLDPELQATVADLEFAHTVLVLGCEPVDEAPIFDLRIRKGVRRNRVALAVAGARPSSLDANARLSLRYPPGGEAEFLAALATALYGGEVRHAAAEQVRALADMLRSGGEEVVILWGERLLRADAAGAVASLTKIVAGLNLRARDGAGLLGVPAHANGRGLLEAGFAPGSGPGFSDAPAGRGAPQIAEALAEGELAALYLLHTDPLRDLPDRRRWERALDRASTVVAHAAFLTDGIREHATVVFPAESHAEKEGTLTHPDGRLQRLRPAIAHPGHTRAEWSVITDLARRLDLDLGALTGPMATAQLTEAVPFYAGLTLEEIGGRGVRWQEREQAAAFPVAGASPATQGAADGPSADREAAPARAGNGEAGAGVRPASPVGAGGAQPGADGRSTNGRGALRLGTFRSVWAAPEIEVSPSMKFLAAVQRLEIAPADAQRLGLSDGDDVVVAPSANGDVATEAAEVRASVTVRAATPAGAVFLQEGIAAEAANVLTGVDPAHPDPARADRGPVLVEVRRDSAPPGATVGAGAGAPDAP